jgi:hypothetical protein
MIPTTTQMIPTTGYPRSKKTMPMRTSARPKAFSFLLCRCLLEFPNRLDPPVDFVLIGSRILLSLVGLLGYELLTKGLRSLAVQRMHLGDGTSLVLRKPHFIPRTP